MFDLWLGCRHSARRSGSCPSHMYYKQEHTPRRKSNSQILSRRYHPASTRRWVTFPQPSHPSMVPERSDNVVVDYHWVNACIDAQNLLGSPNWGGHYLSPITLDHFFNTSPPTTSQPSPSLSQDPTLVSPPYTQQFLPKSDAPPSRKPSLPTIPPQTLPKFQLSGPGTSPTGYFSSQSATTPFGEDQLSRQLSATTEKSTSTEQDPATPPAQSPKKQMGGGNSNKYYYTGSASPFPHDLPRIFNVSCCPSQRPRMIFLRNIRLGRIDKEFQAHLFRIK